MTVQCHTTIIRFIKGWVAPTGRAGLQVTAAPADPETERQVARRGSFVAFDHGGTAAEQDLVEQRDVLVLVLVVQPPVRPVLEQHKGRGQADATYLP